MFLRIWNYFFKVQEDLNEQLLEAASDGNAAMVESLLDQGADPNFQSMGWSPLIYTARGSSDCVRLLLKAGASVNFQGVMGWTALLHAASKGSSESVGLLLEEGADPNARDSHGYTALHYAIALSHNIASVNFLLKAGATLDEKALSALKTSSFSPDEKQALLKEAAWTRRSALVILRATQRKAARSAAREAQAKAAAEAAPTLDV
ncbi:MAG: Ankyrin [Gammaproteobacteria bacterium]|jgi:cytohesin|nr:Ankyrin [Gammaproteobacteria bacterium]